MATVTILAYLGYVQWRGGNDYYRARGLAEAVFDRTDDAHYGGPYMHDEANGVEAPDHVLVRSRNGCLAYFDGGASRVLGPRDPATDGDPERFLAVAEIDIGDLAPLPLTAEARQAQDDRRRARLAALGIDAEPTELPPVPDGQLRLDIDHDEDNRLNSTMMKPERLGTFR